MKLTLTFIICLATYGIVKTYFEFREYKYLSTNCESHTKHCETKAARFFDVIVIKAFSGEGDYPEIQKALELAARQIERIIDINVIGLNSDISPNIAVIPLTPETITSLKNTEWVGLDTSYVDMTLPKVLSENGCAARILINENNEKLDEIRFVYLFANPKTDLNACILEELINGIGIFADPPNYSSLFDSPRHMLMSGYTLNRNTHRLIRFHYSDFPKTIWGWLWFKANR